MANSWVVGASWQNAQTMARLMGSWNDIRQKAHFMVLLSERGHLMILDGDSLNDAIWNAPPTTSWRRIFANHELCWGMDTFDVIALEDGRYAFGSVMPDHGYYLQYMYKTWAGEPMDVLYSFFGGLSGFSWLIYPETEGREAFEALEREIADMLTRELETAEIKVRPRPADEDVNARFKDMGISEWDNGETIASLSGNFYADGDKENCIIVSLLDRKHPYNASYVEYRAERQAIRRGEVVDSDK